MEDQVLIDEIPVLSKTEEDNTYTQVYETESLQAITEVQNIDIYEPAMIGFGVSGAMCLVSIGIASVLKMFRSA